MNINNTVIMGRFTKDPQFYPACQDGAPDQKDRCWGILAVNPPTKNEKAKAAFIPVNAFGPAARVMAQYGKKGKVWGVMGSLRTTREELPNGEFKNYFEVSVRQNVMGPDAAPKGVEDSAPAEAATEAPKADLKKAAEALADAGFSPEQVAAVVASKKEHSGDAPF